MVTYQLATYHQLEEVTTFIASINQHREHNNPWLPSDAESIKQKLAALPFEEAFVLALSDEPTAANSLIGVLGYYPFPDQGLIRLLGPYVQSADWNQVSTALWEHLLPLVPSAYTKCRVSLDEQNQNALAFFDGLGFRTYNAEASLSLALTSPPAFPSEEAATNPNVTIRPYTPDDLEAFTRLHPRDAYFTASEIVSRISDTQSLFVVSDREGMVGYAYAELLPSVNAAELCFIRVLEEERNKRYGSLLLKHVIQWARTIGGVSRLELSVRLDNTAARRLYERFGFREDLVCVSLEKHLHG